MFRSTFICTPLRSRVTNCCRGCGGRTCFFVSSGAAVLFFDRKLKLQRKEASFAGRTLRYKIKQGRAHGMVMVEGRYAGRDQWGRHRHFGWLLPGPREFVRYKQAFQRRYWHAAIAAFKERKREVETRTTIRRRPPPITNLVYYIIERPRAFGCYRNRRIFVTVLVLQSRQV